MTSIIPQEKEVSFVHFNLDWGYMAYIEKGIDVHGEPTWRVVKVALEGNSGGRKSKKGSSKTSLRM